MTGARSTGYVISFLLHGAIILAMVVIPLYEIRRQGSIALDFSITHPDSAFMPAGGPGRGVPDRAQGSGRKPVSGAPKDVSRSAIEKNAGENPANDNKDRLSIEPQGSVTPAGDAGVHRMTAAASSGGASGGAKTLDFATRPGGADERHFSFVRETILREIVYPERARRNGWEGKVLLSFVVRENGSIGDVRVITGSGFSVLDENARDTIAKTNLKRKVPVRLYVMLPVRYELE